MRDLRDVVDQFFADHSAWSPDVRLDVEAVEGRQVNCDEPDCPRVAEAYSTYWAGGHSHYVRYDTPHERAVIRLPAYAKEAQDA